MILNKGKITFSMIKPDAVADLNTGNIIQKIEDSGFKIKALKMIRPPKSVFENFYAIHKERSFFSEMIEYISSGPVVVMILEKENAVAEFRELIGATNPLEAKEGTIRKMYGKSIEANAIHGSDSDENAFLEISHFFNLAEIVD
jgi:nucleoside-diphosphate kinase